MTTITLPPEIDGPLSDEARRRGTTPELLALDTLRLRFIPPTPTPSEEHPGSTLADFLDGYMGLVEGSTEAFSENCGERFAEGLAEERSQERS
jgi:hypothetical protein